MIRNSPVRRGIRCLRGGPAERVEHDRVAAWGCSGEKCASIVDLVSNSERGSSGRGCRARRHRPCFVHHGACTQCVAALVPVNWARVAKGGCEVRWRAAERRSIEGCQAIVERQRRHATRRNPQVNNQSSIGSDVL